MLEEFRQMKISWFNFNGGGTNLSTSPVKNELKRSYVEGNWRIGEGVKTTNSPNTPKHISLASSPTGLNKRRRRGVTATGNKSQRSQEKTRLARRIAFRNKIQ